MKWILIFSDICSNLPSWNWYKRSETKRERMNKCFIELAISLCKIERCSVKVMQGSAGIIYTCIYIYISSHPTYTHTFSLFFSSVASISASQIFTVYQWKLESIPMMIWHGISPGRNWNCNLYWQGAKYNWQRSQFWFLLREIPILISTSKIWHPTRFGFVPWYYIYMIHHTLHVFLKVLVHSAEFF